MQLCIQECYMPTLSCATFWQIVYCHWSAGNRFCGPTPSYQVFSCGQLQSSCIRNQGISASCPAPPPTLPQVNNVSTASEGLASIASCNHQLLKSFRLYISTWKKRLNSNCPPCNQGVATCQFYCTKLHLRGCMLDKAFLVERSLAP